MELETFRELLAPAGQAALADAVALAPTEADFLRHFEKLRKRYPAEFAKAALETALLRIRANGKHSGEEQLYFTREALEQSSSEAISKHRAKRFARFGHVLDLCSGIGIDAIELARAGCGVTAIDSDPLRLAMARANAEALGVTIRILEGDVLTMPLPQANTAFVDPSRRDGERRFLDPGKYQPPLAAVQARFPLGFPLAAKIAPGVAQRDLDSRDAECEFISSAGELKECVLWFGGFKTARRRATVLDSTLSPLGRGWFASAASKPGEGLFSPDPSPPTPVPSGERGERFSLGSDDVLTDPPPAPVGQYLFDPDAAVIRAGLLPLLCERIAAAPVDHGVAMLTGDAPAESPFADCYRVEAVLPMHIGKLRDYLRERRIGRLTILKRAVEIDVNDVLKQLKLAGSEHRHVIVTRSLGKRVAVVAISRRPR